MKQIVRFPDQTGNVSKCSNNMADERDDIRETDLNDDMISGAIGTNATTSIDFKEDDPQHFPGMDEMLKVATDLQGSSGHTVQLTPPSESPRLEIENSGKEI